jgi:hypothetical protein
MSDLRCQYSGVPIHVARPRPGRGYFSCSGCFLASRILINESGNFPITRTLIAVLAGGLVFFNQGLFWLLAWLLEGQGRTLVAGRFLVASLALGAVLWLLLVAVQERATGGGRWTDRLIIVFTGMLVAAAVITKSPGCMLAAVVVLVGWGLRGLRRKQPDV